MEFLEKCRVFLEEQIKQNPENRDLLDSYNNLIDKYAELERKRLKAAKYEHKAEKC